MKLSSKQELFCHYYHLTRNHKEAAARAGYMLPDRAGLKLLTLESIKQRIEQLDRQTGFKQEAIRGLKRIAFGSITDAVKLVLSQGEDIGDLECLDLYMISEIKRPKGGGMEIKFYDRLKALEQLNNFGEHSTDTALPFYRALENSANKLFDGGDTGEN